MKRRLFLLITFALLLATTFSVPANADALSDLATLYNAAPAELRPFDLNEFENMLKACQSQDAAQCIDTVANSSFAQQADLPSWVPMWIKVYFDLSPVDYWALLEDAGEAIACTAANVILDVDICGAIKELVEAAKALYDGAQAVISFLGDVLGAAAAGLKDVYCDLGGIFGGCDDPAPQPPPEAVAFSNFYFPRIQDGVWNREQSPQQWEQYKKQVQADCAKQVGAGCGGAYPAFEKAVYVGWDNDVLGHWIPQVKSELHSQWEPAQAANHLGDANSPVLSAGDPWSMNTFIATLVGMECDQDVANRGSAKVINWLDAGQGAVYKAPAPWVPYNAPCAPFKAAFTQALNKAAYAEGINRLQSGGVCSKATDNPLVYNCTETEFGIHTNTGNCSYVLATLGGFKPPNQCYGPKWYWCPQQNAYQSTKFNDPAPAGCTVVTLTKPGKGDVVAPSAKCMALKQQIAEYIKNPPPPNSPQAKQYQKMVDEMEKACAGSSGGGGNPEDKTR